MFFFFLFSSSVRSRWCCVRSHYIQRVYLLRSHSAKNVNRPHAHCMRISISGVRATVDDRCRSCARIHAHTHARGMVAWVARHVYSTHTHTRRVYVYAMVQQRTYIGVVRPFSHQSGLKRLSVNTLNEKRPHTTSIKYGFFHLVSEVENDRTYLSGCAQVNSSVNVVALSLIHSTNPLHLVEMAK